MYKQPDSGSSGTINIRSAPLAKSSQRAILASARLAKTTMASSSSSRSKPKSCKRRTSSIFTASMRTSFPSCRALASILIYRESVRFGCVPSPATTQPAEESPPPILIQTKADAGGEQPKQIESQSPESNKNEESKDVDKEMIDEEKKKKEEEE